MIIFFSNYDDINNPYYGGGGAYAVHEVARRLSAKHTVTVLTGSYPGAQDTTIDRVYYKRIGWSRAGALMGQLIYQFILPFYALRCSYDMWVESFTPPFSTAFLPLFTRRPVVGLVHLLGGYDKAKEYKLPFYLIENLGLKLYRSFIVLTIESANHIKKHNNHAAISVIPNGVNLIPLKKATGPEKHILYLGRIELDQKGLDMLPSIFPAVFAQTKLDLVVAGAGRKEDREKLIRALKKAGIKKRVHIVGRVDGREKHDLLRNAALVVIPSRYETYSLVVLEAGMYQKPVVCFDIEGLSWISKSAVVKIPAFDTAGMASAIVALINDVPRRRKLGESMHLLATRYSWDEIADRYENVITKAAGA